jgi:Transposase DDE domain group 1
MGGTTGICPPGDACRTSPAPPANSGAVILPADAWRGTAGPHSHSLAAGRGPGPGRQPQGRPEAVSWCERERVGDIFRLAGNKVLLRRLAGRAEDAAVSRIRGEAGRVRRYGDFAYPAKARAVERPVIARVEPSDRGSDSRFIVTNLAGSPRWLYEALCCARAKATARSPRVIPTWLLDRGHVSGRSSGCRRRWSQPVATSLAGARGLGARARHCGGHRDAHRDPRPGGP